MQFISCHNGKIQRLAATQLPADAARGFVTGLAALDGVLPEGRFAGGAVHEVLSPPETRPMFFALVLAQAAMNGDPDDPIRSVVWCDEHKQLYPPSLAAAGMPLERLVLLRPQRTEERLWAITECLRCRGVAAVVADVGKLSRIEARRLQLAAEMGGGVGILLRPTGRASAQYAAATRWLVEPCPAGQSAQRWKVQLVHGHGGRVGQSVLLEVCRETHHVRAVGELADRHRETEAMRVSA